MKINLPNISEESCPTDDAGRLCSELFLEDELIIKPGRILACSTAADVQFRAYLRSRGGEINVTQALTWESSDTTVFTVNASSGLVNIVAAGSATLTAKWQNMAAHANVVVLAGATCCDALSIGTVLTIDRSRSMAEVFGANYTNKFEVARILAKHLVAGLDTTKDNIALQEFDESSRARVGLTNSVTVLSDSIDAMAVTRPEVITDGNTNLAEAVILALDSIEACAEEAAISQAEGGEDEEEEDEEETIHNHHGSGDPPSGLGVPGDTYVNDDTQALYWKSTTGWFPQ